MAHAKTVAIIAATVLVLVKLGYVGAGKNTPAFLAPA